jgi:hypothetical protein
MNSFIFELHNHIFACLKTINDHFYLHDVQVFLQFLRIESINHIEFLTGGYEVWFDMRTNYISGFTEIHSFKLYYTINGQEKEHFISRLV